jgi:hypothetical protein
MSSFEAWLRVALIRTDVSEERIAYIIRVLRIDESCRPDGGGDTFLRNVGSFKSHTA